MLLFTSTLLTPLALLAALRRSQAYKIDVSCKDYYELVHDSVVSAFDMAAAADNALRDPLQRHPDDQRLADLLFNPNGVKGPPVNTDAAWRSFHGLAQLSTLNTNQYLRDPNEVIIYCSLDRLQKRRDNRLYDEDMDAAVDPKQIKELTNPGHELASTFKHSAAMFPAQITINTWFLQWAYHARYKRWNDWSITAALATLAIPVASQGWPLTPIDAVSLLDKVLLHELTHTAAGGSTDDVTPAVESLPLIERLLWDKPAYGWLRAKELAMYQGPGHARSAQNNADSLALFALGVRLRQTRPPSYITDKGYIVSTNPRQRRSVPPELMWPASKPPDGFITMIRDRRAAETGHP